MPRFTQTDLQAALDACGGHGYSTRRHLTSVDDVEVASGERLVRILDAAVVARASELGLSQSDLDLWVDSKLGRWLVDDASGLIESDTQEQAEGAQRLVVEWITIERLSRLRDLGISS